jgi:hypothetical protein
MLNIRPLTRGYRIAGVVLLLEFLPACSAIGSVAPQPAEGAPVLTAGSASAVKTGSSQLSPDANKFHHVIYGQAVDIYTYKAGPGHKEVKYAPQEQFKLAIATDKQDNLYIGSGETGGGGPCCGHIDVFTPGGTQPSRVLDIQDYSTLIPASVSVSRNGYVAATLASFGSSPASVMLFAPGRTTPCANVTSKYYGLAGFLDSAFDHNGDLYVVAYLNNPTTVYSVAKVHGLCHAMTIARVDLTFNNGAPFAIAVDSSNNLAAAVRTGSSATAIDVFPPGSTKPSKVVVLSGGENFRHFVFEHDGTKLWITAYHGGFAEFSYPAGGAPIGSIPPPYGSSAFVFAAVAPPEEP